MSYHLRRVAAIIIAARVGSMSGLQNDQIGCWYREVRQDLESLSGVAMSSNRSMTLVISDDEYEVGFFVKKLALHC